MRPSINTQHLVNHPITTAATLKVSMIRFFSFDQDLKTAFSFILQSRISTVIVCQFTILDSFVFMKS